MANDSFVKTWLKDEFNGNKFIDHQQELQNYLLGIKTKYNYNSVFLVSEATKNYYHFQGVNKVISPEDEHDQWYYIFRDSDLLYDLDIDTDEVNQNQLSVFINCRIVDVAGNLLGVTGVGMEIDRVQDLLRTFENDFKLEAMLFNRDGFVQIHSNETFIENRNVFDIEEILRDNKERVISNNNSLEIYQYDNAQTNGYLITRYIEDLDWYLLIKKDTTILAQSFQTQLGRDFIIFIVVVMCVLLIVNWLIKRNEKILNNLAKTDSLTDLLNRRGFNEALEVFINDAGNEKPYYVFVLDIDNFKDVNDRHGHLIGDKIIRLIGQIALDVLSDRGVISRWGGDEFAGSIYGEKQHADEFVAQLFQRIQNDPELQYYKITISMGITRAHQIDTVDTMLYRADQALYMVKESGKKKCVFIDRLTDKA
jgi:diguanylate cyclase (GGDEF)-like protein